MSNRLTGQPHAGKAERAPRVLIVEDDALIAWDMSLSLLAAGFEVCEFVHTGVAALEQAAAADPDFIVMNVNLQAGMDGIAVAHALRARGVRARIIFVTGFGDPDTTTRIAAFNLDGYLLKPVMPEALAAAVRRVLRANPVAATNAR